MKDHIRDKGIRDLYIRNAPSVDSDEIWEGVRRRVSGPAHMPERESMLRHRHTLRVVLYASLAVVIVAAITVGSLEAVKHLGNDQPILVITDDTTGVSPGSTGQIAQSADSQPSAAMFRGNAARTGVYPDGGPVDEPELLWKFKTSGGEEGSSPVVSGGIVYVAGADWYLYALDAQSGEERWEFPSNYGGVTSSPAVAGGVVYFGTKLGYLYALDAESGLEKWKFQTGDYIESSPAVADGVVYFGSYDGYLYALDAQSGEERWKFQAHSEDDGYLPPFKSSPAVTDGMVYFGSYDGYLYALDAQSGEERWKFQTSASGVIESSPAVAGGVVYFGAADEDAGPRRFDGGNDGYLYALDAASGQLKWKSRAGDTAASPAVADGVVYFFGYEGGSGSADSPVVALDAASGEELWRFQKPSSFRGFGMGLNPSPSVSDGVVYFAAPDEDQRIHALDAVTGEELWTWVSSGSRQSSPAIWNGVLYFSGGDGYIYALGNDRAVGDTTDDIGSPPTTSHTTQTPEGDASAAMFRGNLARTGVYPEGGPIEEPQLLWKFDTGEGEGSSPAVSDGVVYVGGGDGSLYALDAQSGELRWTSPWKTEWGAPSCPAASEGVVYIGSLDGHLSALDAATGQELWRFQTGDYVQGPAAVFDGVVYFGSWDGYLYALDAQTGELQWRFKAASDHEGTAFVNTTPAISDGVLYLSNWDGCLYALDAQTGEQKWGFGPGDSLGPWPRDSLRPWSSRRSSLSSPAVSDGVVYFVNQGFEPSTYTVSPNLVEPTEFAWGFGYLYALDAQTGQEKWIYKTADGIRCPPAVSNGLVYYLNTTQIVALDATTGNRFGLWDDLNVGFLNDNGWGEELSSPSISGDVIYFGTCTLEEGGRLHARDARTGEELWTWVTSRSGYAAHSSPAISDGVVYFSGNDGYLYALE